VIGPDTFAAQLAVEPPLLPAQLQFHGPVPLTGEGGPTLQRLVLGAMLTGTPSAVPQLPLTGGGALRIATWALADLLGSWTDTALTVTVGGDGTLAGEL
jgi:hypothetical protein